MSQNRWSAWVLAVLALWGVPAFLFWTGIGIGLAVWRDQQYRECSRTLDRVLTNTAREGERAIERTLDAEFKRIRGSSNTPASRASARSAMIARFPSRSVRLFLVDGNGKLLSDPSEPALPLFQRCYDYLSHSWWDPYPFDYASFEELKSLIPFPDRLTRLRDQEGRLRIIGADSSHGPFHVAGYFRRGAGGGEDRISGLLAFVWPERIGDSFHLAGSAGPENLPDCGIGYLCENTSKEELPPGASGWFQVGDAHLCPPDGWTIQDFRKLIEAYRFAATSRLEYGEFLVEGRSFRSRSLILGLTPLPGSGIRWLALLFLVYALVSFRLQLWMYDVLVCQSVVRHPLKLKLGLLFLLGGVFPLTAAGAIGALYLHDKQAEIAIEHRQRAFARLDRIDSGYEAWVSSRERRYRELVRTYNSSPGQEHLATLLQTFREFQSGITLDDYFLISSAGTILAFDQSHVEPDFRLLLRFPLEERKRQVQSMWDAGRGSPDIERVDCLAGRLPPEKMGHRIKKEHRDNLRRFLPKMATGVMQEHNRRLGITPPTQTKASELLIDDLAGEDGRMAFNLMKFSLGRFGANSVMGNAGYIFGDVLTDTRGEAQYFLILAQNFICLQWEYLEAMFPKESRMTTDGELRIIGWMRDFSPSYPLESRDPYQSLHDLFGRTGAERLETRLSVGNEEREVLVQKGKALIGFDLLISIPADAIGRQLEPYRWRVLAFLAGTLVFSLLLGWMLLEKVLIPVQEIAEGVAALTRKEFGHRVRVRSEDELGLLCGILNKTIAHFSDMEIASTVQNMLYPTAPMRVGRFAIDGRNIMTQAIGGDYYDYFLLPNGTVAVILGDVSGHGFSAALVTAMAKAAFTILCPRFPNDPQGVFTRVNDHLLEILQRSKMMTCVLILLNPETGAATVCNAGQAYPVLIDGTGKGVLLELGSTPLGIRRKSRSVTRQVDLASGTLVLYSDGLIEANGEDGEPIGYSRFKDLVGASVVPDPGVSCEAILRRVREITDPIPWTDDATLLVISPHGDRSGT